jgi:hypothetical protein
MSNMITRFATLRPAVAGAMVALGLAAAIGGATAARADEVWRTYEWWNGRQVLVERYYVTPRTYAAPPPVVYEAPPPRVIYETPPRVIYEAPPVTYVQPPPPPVTYIPPPPVTVITTPR